MNGSRWADEHGLVGKTSVVWLLLVAVLVVGAVDAVSIALTTFRLSEVATEAASDGVVAFRGRRSVTEACQAVVASVEAQDPNLKIGKHTCEVDATTGRVTVTLKAAAGSVIAGRLDATKPYTQVLVSESVGASNV